MPRYYTAPPDDPHGNAGKLIGTDDAGNFWIAQPGEGGGQPMTFVGGDNPPGGTGDTSGFDPTKDAMGRPLRPGQRWERAANGNWVFIDPYAEGQKQWEDPRTGQPTSTPPGGGRRESGGLGTLADAVAAGNTFDQDTRRMSVVAQIEDAARRYALAVTAEQRNQALLDLQRWQTELSKLDSEANRYTDVAQTILSAAVGMGSRPADYFKHNQVVSGGRDIFRQMHEGRPDFAGPAGLVEPGSVDDLVRRLGLQFPKTPQTPAGVQPGAANPGVTPGGGTTAGGGERPGLDAMKQGLKVAGWGGNYDDPEAVASAWWDANPARKGTPRPPRWW